MQNALLDDSQNSELAHLQRQLLVERVRLHSRALIRLPVIEMIFLLVLTLVLRPAVPWPVLGAWGTIVLTVSCARAGLALYVQSGSWQSPPRLQSLVFIAMAWCSGAAYGFGAAWMLRYMSVPSLFLFAGTMLALPAVGLLITKASQRTLIGYGALIMVPLGIALAIRFPAHAGAMPFLVLAYLLAITLATRNTQEVLKHVTLANQRRNKLIKELEKRHIEVQQAMAHAQRSAENRTRVLASASHDLRQPLHALSTYAAVLEEDSSQKTIEHVGKKVDDIIASLSNLLQKLLELSQLIAGQVSLNQEEFSLSEVVSEVVAEFTPVAQAKGLRLVIDLAPISALGDPQAVSSIARSLIENAIRFTESGEVRVQLAPGIDRRSAILCISDTGIGVAAEAHEAIFDEYFQVGNLARDRHQGVGLGLSIAQRLSQLMGTSITLSSRPGEGSRFEIALPLRADADPAPLQPASPAPQTVHQASEAATAQAFDAALASSRSNLAGISQEAEVQEEYVYIHAQAASRVPGIHALIVAGLATQLTAFIKIESLLAWGLILLLLDLGRFALARWVVKRADSGQSVRKYQSHLTAFAMLTSCALIGGWALLANQLPAIQLALTATILFVIPPVAVTLTQSSRRIQMAYTLPFLITLATVVCQSEPAYTPMLPLVTLMMCGLVYLAALDVEKLIGRAVKSRRELDSIARKLEASNEDIRKAAEQAELASAQRVRALASASHDLRQPLNALSLCNAVLVTGLSPARLAQVVGTVRKIVQMLGGLLHNLLDLSRIESGNPLLGREAVEISHVLSEVCQELKPAADHKGLELELDLTAVTLQSDPLAISRIARNLIENAIKYSTRGRITVRCMKDETAAQAIIEVRDQGIGIPHARLGQVFDEYFQVAQTGRSSEAGIGLGLSIVKSLSLLMEGSVEVESEPGKGSIFRVRIPLGGAPTQSTLPEKGIPVTAFRSRKVLVIDDDIHVADSMYLLITTWGMSCQVARDANQAEALLQQHGVPDLILLDLRLPGPEHGAGLAQRLFARYGRCPVIVITGETADDSVADAIRLGFTVLKKPVMREALLQALHKVFESGV